MLLIVALKVKPHVRCKSQDISTVISVFRKQEEFDVFHAYCTLKTVFPFTFNLMCAICLLESCSIGLVSAFPLRMCSVLPRFLVL